MAYNDVDLTGQKIGFLTILERLPQYKKKRTYYRCKCDCGNEIITSYDSLSLGHSRSCGCYQRLVTLKRMQTHGKTNTILYQRWSSIKQRCYCPNYSSYCNYGARGIKVCDEWKNDFMKFYDWALNNGFSKDLSIDRIDVNGDYCPENCRWVNNIEQANNKRNNRFITYNGKKQTVAQWARELGISHDRILNRLKLGWDISKIFTTPIKVIHKKEKKL